MAGVDRCMEKVAELVSGSDEGGKAQALKEAISVCQEALETLEKILNVPESVRERKSSGIMSVIYWCRKMMPIDLIGVNARTRSGPSRRRGGDEPAGGDMAEGDAPGSKAAMVEYDKLAFDRAKAFAKANPNDLDGILVRLKGVAASYPTTGWGIKAAQEAEKVRERLGRTRGQALARCRKQLLALDFDGAIKGIDADIARKTDPRLRRQLEMFKQDTLTLRRLWERVAGALEKQAGPRRHALEDLGLKREGFLVRGSLDHVEISSGDGGKPSRAPWKELGAGSVARLGERLLGLRDDRTLEELAVGAAVAEDWTFSHRMFERLMAQCPERMGGIALYFERATDGYRASAEGDAEIRLKEAEKLSKAGKFPAAMAVLNALRKGLARNSELEDALAEVNAFRRKLMRRKRINAEGKPLTSFEKLVVRAFGGEVTLDRDTGAIEVLYDFSESSQLRDWMIVRELGAAGRAGAWRVRSGKAVCSGGDDLLMWKFPIKRPNFKSNITFTNPQGRVLVSAKITEKLPRGILGWMRGGYIGFISSYSGRHLTYKRSSDPYYIWRKGEAAEVRYYARRDQAEKYFEIELNGKYVGYTYDSRSQGLVPGRIAIAFEDTGGTVDNVLIRGILDMNWFAANVGRAR
jgi:hypothetical protein